MGNNYYLVLVQSLYRQKMETGSVCKGLWVILEELCYQFWIRCLIGIKIGHLDCGSDKGGWRLKCGCRDASRMNQSSIFVLHVDFLSFKLLGFTCYDLIGN